MRRSVIRPNLARFFRRNYRLDNLAYKCPAIRNTLNFRKPDFEPTSGFEAALRHDRQNRLERARWPRKTNFTARVLHGEYFSKIAQGIRTAYFTKSLPVFRYLKLLRYFLSIYAIFQFLSSRQRNDSQSPQNRLSRDLMATVSSRKNRRAAPRGSRPSSG